MSLTPAAVHPFCLSPPSPQYGVLAFVGIEKWPRIKGVGLCKSSSYLCRHTQKNQTLRRKNFPPKIETARLHFFFAVASCPFLSLSKTDESLLLNQHHRVVLSPASLPPISHDCGKRHPRQIARNPIKWKLVIGTKLAKERGDVLSSRVFRTKLIQVNIMCVCGIYYIAFSFFLIDRRLT